MARPRCRTPLPAVAGCVDFVPQLNVYAHCLEKATGAKPLALLVHLPIAGALVQVGQRKV